MTRLSPQTDSATNFGIGATESQLMAWLGWRSGRQAKHYTARSNWTPELDHAFQGLFPARVPGVKGSTGDANSVATIEVGAPVIEAFDIRTNREIHITNNAGHIQALNDGHSQQAPADFVRIAVLEGLATVRGARIVDD